VSVLPSPAGGFSMSRISNTIWVLANDQNVASYAWKFGDGTTAIGRSATHTYANVETLEASLMELTVTGQNGCSVATFQYAPPPIYLYVPLITR
jgi:chitodextrinase